MSDTDTIRRALGAFKEDSDKQGDRAAIRNALDDTFYAALDSIYKLPYASSSRPSTPIPPKPATPIPPKPVLPPPGGSVGGSSASMLATNPARPAQVAQPPTIANMLQGIQDNITGGQQWAQGQFNIDPNIENVIGAGAGILNTIGGVLGSGVQKVGEGLNVLDATMTRDRLGAPLPPTYKPFTEQVADIAGQYNERIAEPVEGIVGNLFYNPITFPFTAPPNQAKQMEPSAPVQQTAVSALDLLQKGNVGGALNNVLTAFGQYGNEQFDKQPADLQFATSLLFDPINWVPGLGLGKAHQAQKLEGLLKDVGKIENEAELFAKGFAKTDTARHIETVRDAVQSVMHNVGELGTAEEVFGTLRAFETAGVAGHFDEIAKLYAGVKKLGGQRASTLIQGFGKTVLDPLETSYRTAQTAIKGVPMDSKALKTLDPAHVRFMEDLKASPAKFPNPEADLLDVTKGALWDQTQAHMAKVSAKKFAPKASTNGAMKAAGGLAGVGTRLLNEIKGAEALVYIGLSPFSFVRNLVNGVTTMAIEGVNPLWDAASEVRRLNKLGQPEKAAALNRAISMQKTMAQTGSVVRGALGEGQFATSQTGAFGSFMSRMINGTPVGKPLRWYQDMENAMRAKVWTQTYWHGIQSTWLPNKAFPPPDAVTSALLSQHGIPDKLITDVIVESGPYENVITKNMRDLVQGKRGAAPDWDALAAEMGMTRADLMRDMGQGDWEKVAQMSQERWNRVIQGEPNAEVVEDVIGRAATEGTQATAERTGQATEFVGNAEETIDDLLARQGELIAQWTQASNAKGGRKIADDLMGEIEAVRSEIARREELGQQAARGRKQPPEAPAAPTEAEQIKNAFAGLSGGIKQGGLDKVDEIVKRIQGGADKEYELRGIAPNMRAEIEKRLGGANDLPTAPIPEPSPTPPATPPGGAGAAMAPPLESELPEVTFPEQVLSQGQANARDYLLTIKRADGSPVYTAKQLESWKPQMLENVAGELQVIQEVRTTLNGILETASRRGVPTATEKGVPFDQNVLNVLNKHKQASAARFATMDDVVARGDEATAILDNYVPAEKVVTPKAWQTTKAEFLSKATNPAQYGKGTKRALAEQHLKEVVNAWKEGKPVPPEVLSDYRDYLPTSAANASDVQLRGIDPDELHGAGQPPTQRMNAAEAIDNLRNTAQEDEAAASILSRDEMTKTQARSHADVLQALHTLWNREDIKRLRLGTDAETRLFGYLRRDVLPAASETRQAATVAADWTDNAVMISRDGETKFDTMLGVLSPFQFWRSRFALQSLRRVADKPARLAWYLKLREGQDQIEDDPRFPNRLRGMMKIPYPFAPAWAGVMFADVLEYGTSLEQVFGTNQFEDEVTDTDIARVIKGLATAGKISMQEAMNANANQSGALWDETKSRLEELSKRTEGADAFSDMFRPHLPFDIAQKIMTGHPEQIGVLFPMTRIVKNLTGVNIEQPLKAGLRQLTGAKDIPDYDMWEEERTDKALADMVGDGLLNPRDALIAMIERKGPAFDQARQRAQEKPMHQMLSVVGGQLFPTGEQEYYRSKILQDKLLNEAIAGLGGNPDQYSASEKWAIVKANGLTAKKSGSPLSKFYAENPAYDIRGSIFDVPEARLKNMLVDEIWKVYNEKGALDRRLMGDDLGAEFQQKFRNADTRDIEGVTLDQLAEWAVKVRGYVPQQEILKPGEFPEVRYGSLEQNERWNSVQAQRDQLFNMDVLGPKLDTYHSMAKPAAYAYRDLEKDLDAYLDWYGKTMRDNPDISKLISPDYQASVGSYVNTRDAANDITRYTTANLDRMIRLIGGRQGRGGGGGAGGAPLAPPADGKLPVLSAKAKQALLQKRKNAAYFIPRDVFEELLAFFKASGIRGGFQVWLDSMVAGGLF